MSELMVHAKGGRRVSEAEVFAIPEPDFTATWHPVSHEKVATSVVTAIEEAGMSIVSREYSIAQSGSLCFAAYTLEHSFNGGKWMTGWRNSVNKKFPVGMVAGTRISICDNLMFSGKFLEFHKHTATMNIDLLNEMARNAMEKTVVYLEKLGDWQEGLKEVQVSNQTFKQIAFDLMYQGAIPPSKLMTGFIPAYAEEKELNGDCLYSVHGAVTRLLRGSSLFGVAERTAPLNRVIDTYSKAA